MTDKWFFVRAMINRAGRTFAQTAAATVSTAMFMNEVDWRAVLSAAVLAAILSCLNSIATGLPECE